MTQPMMKTLMKVMADSAAIENGAEMPPPPPSTTFDDRLVVDDVEFADDVVVDAVEEVDAVVRAAGLRPIAGQLNAG